VVFFLELFHATGDSTFRESAIREGQAIFQALRAGDIAEEEPGLYDGLAGIGFALNELGRVSQRELFLDAARAVGQHLDYNKKQSEDGGVSWNESHDITSGTAGIGLAMLYLSNQLSNSSWQQSAAEAGRHLFEHVHRTGDGWWWYHGTNQEQHLPNFSHGTAGIGYFFAELYEQTGETAYLEGAVEAATLLRSIALPRVSLMLVPYGVPNTGYDTPYDIGWAHGPAGTARLFYQLWTITEGSSYLDDVKACAKTVMVSGVPGPSADTTLWREPFGIDRRFGTSGAADFLLDYFSVSGDSTALQTARAIADDLISRATRDSVHAYWVIPRYEFQGNEGADAAFTGIFYGASGIGLTLLHMHYADHNQQPLIRLPDDPF